MKETLGEILWKALEFAKQDRLSLIDAYNNIETEDAVKMAKRDYKNFSNLQIKLFGTSDSKLNAEIKKMKSIDLLKLIASKKDFDEFWNENS